MVDFTEAEQSYINLFERMKRDIPLKDVSVFQQPITTREELLNTILARPPGLNKYVLAPFYTFEKEKKQATGAQTSFYDAKGDTYPFWRMKNQKGFSDLLSTAIVNYMPLLTLPDASTLVSGTVGDLAEFQRHYDTSIQVLLDGPPHANQHRIHTQLAKEWVDRQKTPERKRLAQLLIDKTRYISHQQLLERLQECVEKTRMKLVDGPITFIVGTKDKSNYYISLLFYHYWIQRGLRVDAVKSHMDGLVEGNLLDIDEMAYSGSQTVRTLASVYDHIVKNIQKQLNLLNASTETFNTDLRVKFSKKNKARGLYGYVGQRFFPINVKEREPMTGILSYREPVKGKYITSYSKSKHFIPVPLLELILHKNNINYIVIRVFCSENGQKTLLEMPPADYLYSSRIKPPFNLVIGEIIPSPTTLFGKEDALKLGFLFGSSKGYPAAPVYFNHKVADLPSTYLNPYAYGVIPDKLLYGDANYGDPISLTPEEQAIYNSLQTPDSPENTTSFLPFIEYCQEETRPMPRSRTNLFNYKTPGEEETLRFAEPKSLPQVFRCPYAWYKNINYDTGIYTPPVELRRGGTRRVKRRTTKRRMTHRK
jgi:hypothetical protein